ncbi:metal binding domain of Ada-domain-containing protein [Aspergillus taichungensis]|uniref:Metal binding domain of Ada-domain-containing protein n=1 Tax=Aspergillus taichungensis TaxID=482145 RepID=A0A2J5HX70_9EURO|nr:metal binding domain of Ada-domain-containing protein [Aspergillus taichungensis]
MSQKDSPQKIPRLTSSTAAARWQAVVNRDTTATTFVYAVLTTKIYCRPSCPARLARRANIQFYDTPSQAEAAGFRPCKRCKPEGLQAVNPQTRFIETACQRIRSAIRDGSPRPTLRELADEAALTPSHFHRVFKKMTGVTPGQYATFVVHREGSGKPVSTDQMVQDGGVQPCGLRDPPCVSAVFDDGGLVGLGEEEGGGGVLWNDFDALIAAELEYSSRPCDALPLDEVGLYPAGNSPGTVALCDLDGLVDGLPHLGPVPGPLV